MRSKTRASASTGMTTAPRRWRSRHANVSATRRRRWRADFSPMSSRCAQRVRRGGFTAAQAFQDLKPGFPDQRPIDLVALAELVVFTVVLRAPVLRHIVPEVEFRDRSPVAGLIVGQERLQRRL